MSYRVHCPPLLSFRTFILVIAAVIFESQPLCAQTRAPAAPGNLQVTSGSNSPTATPTVTHTTGAVYYVAKTGNNTNSGTEASPFLTITKGVSVLRPGSTLYIKTGIYDEYFSSNIPGGTAWTSSGSGTGPVTIAAYPGQSVTIKPSGLTPTGSIIHLAGPAEKYIIFDGLIIDGANVDHDGIYIKYQDQADPFGTAAHHIRVQNTVIKNTGETCLTTFWGYSNEFLNLDLNNCSRKSEIGTNPQGHGLYIKSAGNLVDNVRIHDMGPSGPGFGIHFWSSSTGPRLDNNIVRNSKIYNNPTKTGVTLNSGDDILFYNNLVYNNGSGGVNLGTGLDANRTKIYNNTFVGNGVYGLKLQGNSVNSIVKNNIFFQNGNDQIVDEGSTGLVQSNNIFGIDPKFANLAGRDLHLISSSVTAIDKGIATTPLVTTDLDGKARPIDGNGGNGAQYDIGAYEFGAP